MPPRRGVSWIIRRADPVDTDAVIDIYLAATIPGQDFLPESFWRGGVAAIRTELMPQAETWVVEDRGEVVAFVAVLGDLIGGLFTLPEHQGSGLGTALTEHVAARRDPLFVEVFEANNAAREFYEHRGFVEDERTIEPTSGLPQLVMRMEGDS